MRGTAWVDAAFGGRLVFLRRLVAEPTLEPLVEMEAILANGNTVMSETFDCDVDWYGQLMPLQVIENESKLPLLGTGLLDQRVLHIDYSTRRGRIESGLAS